MAMSPTLMLPRASAVASGPTSGAFSDALIDLIPFGYAGPELALSDTPSPLYNLPRDPMILYDATRDALLVFVEMESEANLSTSDDTARHIVLARATNVKAAKGNPQNLTWTFTTPYSLTIGGNYALNGIAPVFTADGTLLLLHTEMWSGAQTGAWLQYADGSNPATILGCKFFWQKSTDGGLTWTGATDITSSFSIPVASRAFTVDSMASNGAGTPLYRCHLASGSTSNMPTAPAGFLAKITGTFTADPSSLNNTLFYIQKVDASHFDIALTSAGATGPTFNGSEAFTGNLTFTPYLAWGLIGASAATIGDTTCVPVYGRLATDSTGNLAWASSLNTTNNGTSWTVGTITDQIADINEIEPGIYAQSATNGFMTIRNNTTGVVRLYKTTTNKGGTWGAQQNDTLVLSPVRLGICPAFGSASAACVLYGPWNAAALAAGSGGNQAGKVDRTHGGFYYNADPTSKAWSFQRAANCTGSQLASVCRSTDGYYWAAFERMSSAETAGSSVHVGIAATNLPAIQAAKSYPDYVEYWFNDLPYTGTPFAWSGMAGVRDWGPLQSHATVSGSPKYNTNGLQFNPGTSDNLILNGATDPTFDPDWQTGDTGDFTLEIGFRCVDSAGSGLVFGSDSRTGTSAGAGTGGYKADITANKIRLVLDDGSVHPALSSAQTVNDGSYYHAVLQRDVSGVNGAANKLRLWVYDSSGNLLDNNLSASDTTATAIGSLLNLTTTKRLMRFGDTATGGFGNNLRVLYFRFYKKALTPTQFRIPPYSPPTAEGVPAAVANGPDDPAIVSSTCQAAIMPQTGGYAARSYCAASPAPATVFDGWPAHFLFDRAQQDYTKTINNRPILVLKNDSVVGLCYVGSSVGQVLQFNTTGNVNAISKFSGAWTLLGLVRVPNAVKTTRGIILQNLDGSGYGFDLEYGYSGTQQFLLHTKAGTTAFDVKLPELVQGGSYRADTWYLLVAQFNGTGYSGAGLLSTGFTYTLLPLVGNLNANAVAAYTNTAVADAQVVSGDTGTTGKTNASGNPLCISDTSNPNRSWSAEWHLYPGLTLTQGNILTLAQTLTRLGTVPADTATTIFTDSLGDLDQGDASGASFRTLISLTQSCPGKVRVTFKAGNGTTWACSHCSIGVSAGSGNTVATPVELLFSGVSGFSIAAGQTIVSDYATLPWTNGQSVVVVTDTSSGGPRLSLSQNVYQKGSSTSYNQATVVGYSNFAHNCGIAKIEVISA